MKKTRVDCVKLQHDGGEAMAHETAGMSCQELLEYWRRGTEQLRSRQRAMREALLATTPPPPARKRS